MLGQRGGLVTAAALFRFIPAAGRSFRSVIE
jgi:hypothetical protein